MSLADLETLYDEAVAAVGDGDFDTAITKAMSIKLRLSTVARSAGASSRNMTLPTPADLDSFIRDCRQQKAAALAATGHLQQTKITYVRPEASEC